MLFVICILCAALALWLAATLFLWHRELLEIQKALEDIGAGNLNRRIVTRGPQAIRCPSGRKKRIRYAAL